MTLFVQEAVGDVVIVRFQSPRFADSVQIDDLTTELLTFTDGLTKGHVVFDLGKVNYLSSAAIGMLIRVSKRLAQKQIPLLLCSLQPMVKEIMFLQRLHLVFDIVATEDKALAACQQDTGRDLPA